MSTFDPYRTLAPANVSVIEACPLLEPADVGYGDALLF